MSAIFGFSGPVYPSGLSRMETALRHRGSRSGNTLIGPDITLAFRSSKDDYSLEKRDCGLFHSEAITIGFAGFLTDRQVLRKRFPQRKESLVQLPTHVLDNGHPVLEANHLLVTLAQAWREYGEAVLAYLRGAFVMMIKDSQGLYLVRDGAGARSLYFSQYGNRTFFAVEPKGIWQLPCFQRILEPKAVARYLSFSFLPGRQTMLRNLEAVLPGHCFKFRKNQPPKLSRFFKMEEAADTFPEPDIHWSARFRQKLGAAIEDRMSPGEPLGAFLSGGIDSSVVVAELVKYGPVKTFVAHFGEKFPNELSFARAVADRLGTQHEEVLIQPKGFLGKLRQIVWHLDDPIGDPVAMPNYLLAEYASKQVSAIFNGEGGDPCFGGPKNITMMLHQWYGGLSREPNFLEKKYLASYRRCYEELPRLLTPEFRNQFDDAVDLESVLTPFFQADKPELLLHKLTSINVRLKGAHLILPKVERMLAAHDLLPLSPLFDERLIELSYAMPPTYILNQGIEKYVLKEAYREALPQEVIDRPKSGMRVPVHYWFRGELKKYARKVLHPKALKKVGIFNPERVAQLLDYNFEEGSGRYGIRLWMLINFEIWRRLVIENESV